MCLSKPLHLDRAKLEAAQFDKLRALFRTTLDSNPFYTAKLRAAGGDRVPESLADFVSQTPLTTKQELVDDQRHNPPYGSNLAFPIDDYCRFHQTSGTTATPVRWLDTRESWRWMVDSWQRIFEAAGTTAKDRIFFPFSFGPFLGFWTAFEAASRMGCLAIPGGGQRSAARLQIIVDNDVTVLCATPTYAIRLGETAAAEKIDLSAAKVRAIIVAGEPGGAIPSTRALIEQLWPGARVFDHYGMTEVGPVSYECPKRRGVTHVMESSYIAEIIDPEMLEPVAPGEVGELILTTLGRIGSPAIRYLTRDLVRAASNTPCECGSYELALEGGILGRADDMVVVRGVNLYPSAVEQVLRADGAVAEFQVEISTAGDLPELRLCIEPNGPDTDQAELLDRVGQSLHRAFGLRFSVECTAPGTLPRFEMKAKRWTRS
jgi:phenylacetate-CoA ligase